MDLDPFFEERLRVHRRYLFDQALGSVRSRLSALWPFAKGPAPVMGMGGGGAGAASTAAHKPKGDGAAAPGTTTAPVGPRARARARHRKAALAWDRRELHNVGMAGPRIRTTEHVVEVPGHPAVRVRVYHPDPEPAPPHGVPGVLSLFGGAFRIGGIGYPTTDAAHRRRALDAGAAVAAVDYALAPEYPYPVAIEQAYAALEWLFASAGELGIDSRRIGVAGTSAGANLAAAVTLVNRDRARLPLRLQVLEVPVVDLTGRHLDLRATRALGIPRFIALRELRSVARTYLPDPAVARHAYASPLLAASHEGLPPAVILTAEYDPLRGDGDAYGAALRRAGVDASVVRYQGVTHDTPIFGGTLPAARRWHDDVVSALRRLHA
ncbi:alpha/beta hydrolase [Microbacterium cremeum]|uniref:alpha/beta hydrolase n=1 Tax=Microbacterium cremeum TaxID=2782169 RepID=UPI0018885E6E|nr:alpha/beta hydrolase [Microbacterium cremeum]